jgi:hypothetical protein
VKRKKAGKSVASDVGKQTSTTRAFEPPLDLYAYLSTRVYWFSRRTSHLLLPFYYRRALLITIYPMLQGSGKRAASSPLGSEFDKKSRLGLTEEEVNDLNKSVRYWMRNSPNYALLNAEDVPTSALALALREVALNMLDTARASTIDKRWLKAGHGEERLNLLSREVQLDLASIWVEARDKGEWERFADHRALRPSDHSLRQMSTQLDVALLQAETPIAESDGARAYARLHDDQVAGLFIQNENLHPLSFALPFSDREILGIPIPGQCCKRPVGAHRDPLQSFQRQSVCSLRRHRPIFGHGKVKNRR